MSMRLKDQVAIVTGAADGIGEAIAELFCEQGARVCVVDINEGLGTEVVNRFNAQGYESHFIKTDISNKDSVKSMVDQVVKKFGPPNVLVNNAGIIRVNNDVLTTSDETWENIFAVNLDGMWNVCRTVLPYMKEARSGSIVNLGSVHSFNIVRNHFPYAVTKHAIIGLTRNLAVEMGEFNIRVNALCPGMVETPTALKIWASSPDPEAARAAIADVHPLRRNATTREMAYPALFLACSESSFMTGQSLIIDGGRSVLYHD